MASRWHHQRSDSLQYFLCRWPCTVKTHRKGGFVVARSIHSSVNHINNAISAILVIILDVELRKLPHIAWSTEDVQKLILAAEITDSTVLMKFDVKEF